MTDAEKIAAEEAERAEADRIRHAWKGPKKRAEKLHTLRVQAYGLVFDLHADGAVYEVVPTRRGRRPSLQRVSNYRTLREVYAEGEKVMKQLLAGPPPGPVVNPARKSA